MAIRSFIILLIFSHAANAQEVFEQVTPIVPPEPLAELHSFPEPGPTNAVANELDEAGVFEEIAAPAQAIPTQRQVRQPCRETPSRISQWWKCSAEPHLRASHWGYPEYFSERPFGTYVNQTLRTQAINGRIAQQVLYQYDFVKPEIGNAAELNSQGRARLRQLIPIMAQTGYPLVIQQTENARLDEARRELLLQQLGELEMDVAPDMVVLQRAPVVGLGGIGEQSFPKTPGWNVLYENRLKQTLDRGSEKLLQEFSR